MTDIQCLECPAGVDPVVTARADGNFECDQGHVFDHDGNRAIES